MDEERLRSERANRGSWKSRVTGLEEVPGGYNPQAAAASMSSHPQRRPRRTQSTPAGGGDDDLEYRLALEASKNEAEMDAARRAKGAPGGGDNDDDDLAKAIKLSKEEEDLRKRELEDQNQANLLFDDTPSTEQVPQPTGFNQGYQQQTQVDWLGNPVQQQQPQQTGYLNNAYSQPTGAFQNGYGGGFGYSQPQQQQQTGFDQMQAPSQQFIQPQNSFNPWAQQMGQDGFGQQQQQQPIQQQQQDQQPVAQSGSNNPWATSNQSTTLAAQPTGSNNPFATHRPIQQTHSAFKAPTLNTLQEQQVSNNFNSRPNPIANFSSPAVTTMTSSPPPQQRMSPLSAQQTQTPQDPYQAKLNALLSSGEGQDTFGNVGDLRIPAQHTAPGTFVNSAGGGSMGRLEMSRTGNNPFFTQAPQQQTQQQFPAQTGPAMGMGQQPFGGGYQGGNPFGSRPPGQGQQQQGQGGSLIDL